MGQDKLGGFGFLSHMNNVMEGRISFDNMFGRSTNMKINILYYISYFFYFHRTPRHSEALGSCLLCLMVASPLLTPDLSYFTSHCL